MKTALRQVTAQYLTDHQIHVAASDCRSSELLFKCGTCGVALAHQPGRGDTVAGERADRLVSGTLGDRDLLHALKNGCDVEVLQLAAIDRLELVPPQLWAGCYIRLGNALGLYKASLDVGLPNSGIPRMHHLEDKPWVFREFALIDPEANLLRIGKIIQPESEIEI